MAKEMTIKRCTSCNGVIGAGENFVEFPCPSCGEAKIIRCEKCKVLVNEYKCPACGFVGP